MAKQEFLMLAHKFDESKFFLETWVSEKFDGCRAFWDGGVTRGSHVSEVPWSDDERDLISTGLWSRGRKSIQAPEWWLDKLPSIALDGELWINYNNFQTLMSIVRRHKPDERWKSVGYYVFDSPPLYHFIPGTVLGWKRYKTLRQVYDIFSKHCDYDLVRPVKQTPMFTLLDLHVYYEAVIERGGEGLILRDPNSIWKPERSYSILKYKPYFDDEATVVGYTWAREGKIYGLMGALICEYQGNRFQLSGFTDLERSLDIPPGCDIVPGKEVPESVTSQYFPRGSTITFKYRELSDGGVPKEASFLRHCPSGE